MATVTSLDAAILEGGVFLYETRDKLNSNAALQNTNNTNLNADIATNTAAIAANAALMGAGAVYHAKYSFAVDGGGVTTITPATNATIPIKFVITNVALNSTTAVTSGGSATVSVGLSAGGAGAAALVAATGKASWSLNAFVQGIPVPQDVTTWIKMSAAGTITITVAGAALTAGIIEIYIFGYLSAS